MGYQASWVQRQLAEEFSQLREAMQPKPGLREVADAVGFSHAKLGRIEGAQSKITPADVAKLATYYKLPPSEIERLKAMADASRTDLWWTEFEPWLTVSYSTLIGYEDEATGLKCVQSVAVPGLLQTRAYASALIKSSPSGFDADKADALLELRMLRQRRLHEPVPLAMHAVISESVLRAAFGGSATLNAQLRHLRTMSELPNVTIQVVPFSDPRVMLPLEIYELGDSQTSVAFSETLWSNSIHEGSLETKRAHRMFEELSSSALTPEVSSRVVEQRIKETE